MASLIRTYEICECAFECVCVFGYLAFCVSPDFEWEKWKFLLSPSLSFFLLFSGILNTITEYGDITICIYGLIRWRVLCYYGRCFPLCSVWYARVLRAVCVSCVILTKSILMLNYFFNRIYS